MSVLEFASPVGANEDHSNFPVLSGDGRWILLSADAGLDPNDMNASHDHYLYDRLTGTSIWVGEALAGDGTTGGSWARDSALSDDGRYAVFSTGAAGALFPGAATIETVIYDRQDGGLALVPGDQTVPTGGEFTADNTLIYFNGLRGDLVSLDPETGSQSTIVTYGDLALETGTGGNFSNDQIMHPSVSADGSVIAYWVWDYAGPDDHGGPSGFYDQHVYVYDATAGSNTRISVAFDGGAADHVSQAPSLTNDGRYVAFASRASNLVENDTNAAQDVFLYDIQSDTMQRLNLLPDGREPTRGCRRSGADQRRWQHGCLQFGRHGPVGRDGRGLQTPVCI